MKTQKVIIGVCTTVRLESLHELIASLSQCDQPKGFSFTLLIIANTKENFLKASEFEGYSNFEIKIVHEPKLGLVNARNRCLDEADRMNADWFMSLDDDVTVSENFLVGHAKAIQTCPDIHLFGCSFEYVYVNPLTPYAKPHIPYIGEFGEKLYTGNSLIVVSREIFGKSGLGLRYGIDFQACGGEDTDFINQIHEAGYESCYNPEVRVYEKRLYPRTTFHEHLETSRGRQYANLLILRKKKSGLFTNLRTLAFIDQFLVFGSISFLVGILIFPFSKSTGQERIGYGVIQLYRTFGAIDYLRRKPVQLYSGLKN